jgi:hypothetical protein
MGPDILVKIGHQTDWVALFSALAVPLAAFIAVGVGVWQGRLQKQQLKQNLYARRVEVYFSLRKFLSDISIGNRPLDLNQCMELLRETKEAEFLFGPEIESLIGEIYRKATHLRTLNQLHGDRQAEIIEIENWLAQDSPSTRG